MPVHVDGSGYLANTTDPDWGGTGTIFLRVLPAYIIGTGGPKVFYTKFPSPWTLNFFSFGEDAAAANILVGFYNGSEGRLSTPVAGSLVQGEWACHIFTWDTTAPNQEYYVDNALKVSSAAAFTIPTGISLVRFGNIDTGAGVTQAGRVFVCDHARWNRVLSADERQTLQTTCCPIFVPRGIVEYHPIMKEEGAGRDLIGNLPLTSVGTFAAERDSPMFLRPASGRLWPGLASVPPLEITAPLLSNPFALFAPTVEVQAAISTLEPPVVSSPFQIFAPLVGTDLGVVPPVIDSAFQIFAPTVRVQESVIREDSRELEPHNLSVRIVDFVAGDDLRISRLYTELAEGIFISKAYLTIKRSAVDDADDEAVIQKTITTAEQMSGAIIDDDTTGGSIQLYFDLSSSDTSLLTPLIPYAYDVQVHTIGNAIYTCEKGIIVMHQGVTAATS
jgi:hypothetical protein